VVKQVATTPRASAVAAQMKALRLRLEDPSSIPTGA